MDAAIRQCVERIYELLVRGQYAEVARLTGGVRLSAEEIKNAASQYPFALQSWPQNQSMLIDSIEVTGSSPRQWSVVASTFTSEEGRSDLSLELTLIESRPGNLEIQFDDMHVL